MAEGELLSDQREIIPIPRKFFSARKIIILDRFVKKNLRFFSGARTDSLARNVHRYGNG